MNTITKQMRENERTTRQISRKQNKNPMKQIKNFWSLNVDEALVANWLKQKDTLGSGYEIFFPINSQFPFVDLIVYNPKNKKTTTIQVKSSQGYKTPDKDSGREYWASGHRVEIDKIDSAKVDFFIFSCYYPEFSGSKKNRTGERKIHNYFVVLPTTKLEQYVKSFKTSQVIRSGRVGFSFYIWDGELCEDWYLKPKIEKNWDNLKFISDAMNNWKIIKDKIK